jgi:hypothetical protein
MSAATADVFGLSCHFCSSFTVYDVGDAHCFVDRGQFSSHIHQYRWFYRSFLLPGMMTKDDDHVLEMKDDDQVSDWTKGLPSNEDLTPLSHSLISQVLASAFRIKHEEPMTADDVRRESRATLRNIFNQRSTPAFDASDAFPAFQEEEEAGKLRHLGSIV